MPRPTSGGHSSRPTSGHSISSRSTSSHRPGSSSANRSTGNSSLNHTSGRPKSLGSVNRPRPTESLRASSMDPRPKPSNPRPKMKEEPSNQNIKRNMFNETEAGTYRNHSNAHTPMYGPMDPPKPHVPTGHPPMGMGSSAPVVKPVHDSREFEKGMIAGAMLAGNAAEKKEPERNTVSSDPRKSEGCKSPYTPYTPVPANIPQPTKRSEPQSRITLPPKPTGTIFAVCVFAAILICSFLFAVFGSNGKTVDREKLSGTYFTSDCIVDNLNWFDNPDSAGKALKDFYDQTGVQPYIVLTPYDSECVTDEQREAYASSWYDDHIDNEYSFLCMYFEEEDPYEIGYLTSANGSQIGDVMDEEAVEIFWSYMDKYWDADLSTDEMFAAVFTKTAEKIMHQSTNGKDVAQTIAVISGVLLIIFVGILLLKEKRIMEAEKAAETERILRTDLNSLADEYK